MSQIHLQSLYPGGDFLSLDATGDLALVGGADGVAGVYSIAQNRVVQALKGGGGSITPTMGPPISLTPQPITALALVACVGVSKERCKANAYFSASLGLLA
jgi:hypothetical protein